MTGSGNRSLLARVGKRAWRTGRKLVIPQTQTRHSLVGPARLWEPKRRFQFEFLTSHGLRPEHRLLDIGCGTLRGGIPLIEYLEPGHYVGIEARAEVLEEGRNELAESGLTHKRPVLIHAAEPAGLRFETPFDMAWAFAVFIHMRDEVLRAYLALVSGLLTDGGSFYANVMLGDGVEGEWQGFPVISRPLVAYESWAASCGLAMDIVGQPDTLGHLMGRGGRGMMICLTRKPPAPT